MKRWFPELILELPEADIPFVGVKGWIAQGERHQMVFFEMKPLSQVPQHSHGSPQWGIVVEGRMELTIDNKTEIYEKGDEYFIPAYTKHSVKFLSECRVVDYFGEKLRYKPKIR